MKDHIHVILPSGAVANVSPDASPELLNALDELANKAKIFMKTERETPEEIEVLELWDSHDSTLTEEGYYVRHKDHLSVIQLLKDQHNKELKEIREEIEKLPVGESSNGNDTVNPELVLAIIDKHIK